MSNNSSFNGYIENNTIVHNLDPRIKIICTLFFTSLLLFFLNTEKLIFIILIVNFIFIIMLFLCSKIKIRILLNQIKSLWFIIIIILINNFFLNPTLNKANKIISILNYNVNVNVAAILKSIKIIFYLIEVFSISTVLITTTSPQKIVLAVIFFLKPLKKFNFPVEEIAMTINIAIYFMPILSDEFYRLYKIQTSRGMSFKQYNLKTNLKNLSSLITPIFIHIFEISDNFAYILKSRGYNSHANRTNFYKLTWSKTDTIFLFLLLIYFFGLIFLKKYFLIN